MRGPLCIQWLACLKMTGDSCLDVGWRLAVAFGGWLVVQPMQCIQVFHPALIPLRRLHSEAMNNENHSSWISSRPQWFYHS